MAGAPLSIGDILMLSQTAWKIGRAFANGKKSAPTEFAEVEREANGLSDALKLVAEALHTDNSILSSADKETKDAVNTILESAHKTLSDLENFVERYQIIKKKDTTGGFVVERKWSEAVLANYRTFAWTTEGGSITSLRDMLQMHTTSLNLTMQALQSQSLARLENTVVPMAKNISTIYERVNGDLGDKITAMHDLIMALANKRASSFQDRAIDDHPYSRSGSSLGDGESIGPPSANLIEQGPAPGPSYFHQADSLRILEAPVQRRPSPELPHRTVSAPSNFYEPSTPTFTITEAGPSDRHREDSAVDHLSPVSISLIRDPGSSAGHDNWNFEHGSPPGRQASICSDDAPPREHPDNEYVSLASVHSRGQQTLRQSESSRLPPTVTSSSSDDFLPRKHPDSGYMSLASVHSHDRQSLRHESSRLSPKETSISSDDFLPRKYPDSGYMSLASVHNRDQQSLRRESSTLPRHLSIGNRFGEGGADPSIAVPLPLNVSPKANTNSWISTSSGGSPSLPPAAWAVEQDEPQPPIETPSSFLGRAKRTKSQSQAGNVVNNFDNPVPIPSRPQSTQSSIMPIRRVETIGEVSPPSIFSESHSFERQLFRNAAILCDVRGKSVEYAQVKPDEPDPRFNVEMVEACKEARICVVRKRENREHGGTKVVTSIWCLTDDGEQRIQQKLSEIEETIPFCSYFEPEKVSLQPTGDTKEIALKFHDDRWGAMLLEEKRTNWVNYYFASENDAVAFQSAVFGRMLIGSYRTTKTTVIHDGIKGTFAFEEQFANIEMLRLWEDDGVATPGAAGGVLALMHISSTFGEGWARWWVNNRAQQLKVKEDGLRYARVKGIDVTVARPRKVTANPNGGNNGGGGVNGGGPSTGVRRPTMSSSRSESSVPLGPESNQKKAPFKKVNGVKIEFRTEEERSQFVSMVKRVQVNGLHLPEL